MNTLLLSLIPFDFSAGGDPFLKFLAGEHIFNKNSVASLGVAHKNVRDRADELSVLDYRASAHPLNDTARNLQKLRIGDSDHHIFCILRVQADFFDFDIIFLWRATLNSREHRRRAGFDLGFECYREGLSFCAYISQMAENSVFAVFLYISRSETREKCPV